MNCIKCYQEIPDGSEFCPYCGADQTADGVQPEVNAQASDGVQPEANAQAAGAQQEEAAQAGAPIHQETNTQYQDPYNESGQGAYNYGNSSQNNTYQDSYQNGNYQNTPPYQQNQGDTVNWVPYLVLSIISTLCCCIPFGIVAIVFSAKINSAVTAGNIEEAKKAAKTAKIWIIVAVVSGVIATIAYLIFTSLISAGSYYYYY